MQLKFWNRKHDALQSEINGLRSALASYQMTHADGWYSNNLGHGTDRDKSEMFLPFADNRASRGELDILYRHGLMRKIVDLPVDDMTRRGIKIDHDYATEIQNDLTRLGILALSNQAAKYGRMFRHGVVFMDVNDGQPLDQPVNLKRVRSVNIASVHDSDYVIPYGFEWRDTGKPILYTLTKNYRPLTIHRDRLMVFDGLDAGFNNRLSNNGMGESIADIIYRPFRNMDVDYLAASTMAKDFNIPIIKLLEYDEKVKGNKKEAAAALKARYRLMREMSSVINGFMMGSQDSMEFLKRDISGYPEVVRLAKEYLCIVTGIPHTKLFNEGTGAGLNNGKGESEDNDWVNIVEALQNNWYAPELNKPIAYIAATKKIYEAIPYHFNPLIPETPLQREQRRKVRAEAEKIEAEADEIRQRNGLVTRQEIRINRWIDNQGDNAERFIVDNPNPPMVIDLPTERRALDPVATDTTPEYQESFVDKKVDSILSELSEVIQGNHNGLYIPLTE